MSPLNERGGDHYYRFEQFRLEGPPRSRRRSETPSLSSNTPFYFPVPRDMVGKPEVVKRNGNRPYIGVRIDNVCGKTVIALLNQRGNPTQARDSFDATLTPRQMQLAAINLARQRYGLMQIDSKTYFGGIRR